MNALCSCGSSGSTSRHICGSSFLMEMEKEKQRHTADKSPENEAGLNENLEDVDPTNMINSFDENTSSVSANENSLSTPKIYLTPHTPQAGSSSSLNTPFFVKSLQDGGSSTLFVPQDNSILHFELPPAFSIISKRQLHQSRSIDEIKLNPKLVITTTDKSGRRYEMSHNELKNIIKTEKYKQPEVSNINFGCVLNKSVVTPESSKRKNQNDQVNLKNAHVKTDVLQQLPKKHNAPIVIRKCELRHDINPQMNPLENEIAKNDSDNVTHPSNTKHACTQTNFKDDDFNREYRQSFERLSNSINEQILVTKHEVVGLKKSILDLRMTVTDLTRVLYNLNEKISTLQPPNDIAENVNDNAENVNDN